MAQEIVDLDVVAGPPKKVRLAGKVYTLPPDLPVELYLRLNQQAQAEMSDHEQIVELYNELLELFRYGDPRIRELPVGLVTLISAIPTIYGSLEPPEPEPVGRRPPRRGQAGTRSTPRRQPPRRSRSSR